MLRRLNTMLFVLISGFCTPYPLAADDGSVQSNPLVGIWVSEKQSEQNTLSLSITRRVDGWSGKIDGEDIDIQSEGTQIRFAHKGGETFSGSVSSEGTLQGTWLQPTDDYGFYSSMATYVELPSNSTDNWYGIIERQPRPFRLYLDVFNAADGTLSAVLRNPERNDILGATRYKVNYTPGNLFGSDGSLVAKRGARHVEIAFNFDPNRGVSLKHPAIPKRTQLTKASKEQLKGYYSRLTNPPARLSPVIQRDDGWEIENPAEAGFDIKPLQRMVEALATADPRSERPQMLHSLLVSRRGRLVVEEYFYGHDGQQVHDTRSMAKVFGSVLVGVARQQGLNISTDYAPIPDIMRRQNKQVPPSKAGIRLHHFLTYTSGLDTSEDHTSRGSEDRLWQQRKEDFWHYTADLPVLHPPGKRYAYSSASANLVGAVIEHHTREPVRRYFHRHLAKPLKFAPYHWNLTPQGVSYLGGGVYMRPRDILKIGAVYASGGLWNGKRIVPASWIETSTSPVIAISPETTGMTEDMFNNTYFGGSQAYIWRVDSVLSNGKTYRTYEATGNGGQTLVIVPELELAVVTTGGNYRMGSIWGKWRQAIIGDHLIPALVR